MLFHFFYIYLHFSTFHCISRHFSASFQHFWAFFYILLHFSVFHCISLHLSTSIYILLHFSAFFYISLHFSAFHCFSLHFFLHFIAFHWIYQHFLALFYMSLHFSACLCMSLQCRVCMSLHFTAFISISEHSSTFHCIPLHFFAFLCIHRHFSAFHCILLYLIAFFCVSLHVSVFYCIPPAAFLCILHFIFHDNLTERIVVLLAPFSFYNNNKQTNNNRKHWNLSDSHNWLRRLTLQWQFPTCIKWARCHLFIISQNVFWLDPVIRWAWLPECTRLPREMQGHLSQNRGWFVLFKNQFNCPFWLLAISWLQS